MCTYTYTFATSTHNTIPQTGSFTNITTQMLAYGFYCNQAMAPHKLAVRYNRSHNATSHNVISECISLPGSSARTLNNTHSIPPLSGLK